MQAGNIDVYFLGSLQSFFPERIYRVKVPRKRATLFSLITGLDEVTGKSIDTLWNPEKRNLKNGIICYSGNKKITDPFAVLEEKEPVKIIQGVPGG